MLQGGGEGVSNFVTECDRRGGGGKCQCDVKLRYTYFGSTQSLEFITKTKDVKNIL